MRYLLVLLLIAPLSVLAQNRNLLVNGGFEEENICAEYKVNCAPEGWLYTIPSLYYYYINDETSHSGSHFIALIAGHVNKAYYRSFVRTRLLCNLRKGHKYRLQFYVRSPCPIQDSAGVIFTGYDFLFEKLPYEKVKPSAYLADSKERLNKRDTSWQRIIIDYTAKGDESFLSLGYFGKADIHMQLQRRQTEYLIFWDDISLVPLDPMEAVCNDWQKRQTEIYNEDERHEYVEKRIRENKDKPVEIVKNTPTKILKVDTLIVPDVLFATNSYQLDKKALLLLDSFVRSHSQLPIDSIVVEGHTDNVGSKEWNDQLSQHRAESVGGYIMYAMSARMITRGWGSERPIADNRQPGGRRKNRRVEIYIYLRE